MLLEIRNFILRRELILELLKMKSAQNAETRNKVRKGEQIYRQEFKDRERQKASGLVQG